jgi:hypothetical protein
MSINITGLSVNYYEDVTKVTVEVYEMIGTIERLKDKLIITLPGKYQNIDEHLVEMVEKELTKNNLNYLKVT